MIHVLITFTICFICFFLKTSWVVFFYPVFFYFGREYTQAEYRYIEAHGKKRSKCPWWCGFAPSAWTAKGLLDFLLPLAVAFGAVLASFLLRP